jgi:hypothetical protein
MVDEPHTAVDALVTAFRSTCYHVAAPGQDLQLRVGQYNAGLAKLLREAWVQGAALLTAWNPGSRLHAREWNEAAQQALERELAAAGHPCLPARNEPDDFATQGRTWIEASVLALGITLPAAREVAARYGQLAFLWIDESATPQLVITAAGDA